MKPLSSYLTKTLTLGSVIPCADNSGARSIGIIGVVGYKGRRSRYPTAGVADMVIASVKSGKPEMKGKIVKAVIVRAKKEWRRSDGMHVAFEDNAAVLVNDEGLPVGTEIKGVVAREVADRYPKVAAISTGLV
ncbi:MAG: 50S ribosomal protein L14 [Candidatus Anstonellales archaeon]